MNLTIVLILLHAVVWSLLIICILYFKKIANTDEITSLWNYRWFYRRLTRMFSTYNRKNKKLSIAVIDIDNFREFNKINIHTGDEVLNEFAYEMTNFFSKDILITRYRLGDEFAIIFPDKSKEETETLFKTLIKHFDSYSFSSLSDDFAAYRIKFCYGLSEINKNSNHVDNLLFEAEAELAKAKKLKKIVNA